MNAANWTSTISAEKTRWLWILQDLLHDCLHGTADFEHHSYVTCSDDHPDNSDRGCPRCLIIQFVNTR